MLPSHGLWNMAESVDAMRCLDIAPVERIKQAMKTQRKHPDHPNKGITLI
jgi:hypothetical protein